MNVFKLICMDFIEGTIKKKRYFLIIFIVILQCMLVQMRLDEILFYANDNYNKYGIIDIFVNIFAGCEPFIKSSSLYFPYGWFAIFICTSYLSFDYMNNDINHFGIQTISRMKKRSRWWYIKCGYTIVTSIFSYLLIMLTIGIFTLITHISSTTVINKNILYYVLSNYSFYQFSGIDSLNNNDLLLIIISPVIVFITLNLFQLFLSLFFKPIFSLAVTIGLTVFSMAWDVGFAFVRTGMPLLSNIFLINGYKIKTGFIICMIVSVLSIIGGSTYFKRYDIILTKEEM